jgi:hypothetical protein
VLPGVADAAVALVAPVAWSAEVAEPVVGVVVSGAPPEGVARDAAELVASAEVPEAALCSWLGRLAMGLDAAVWVASEDSASEDESAEEDSSPIAARIASSHAWAASEVGAVWAAVAVAEPGTVPWAPAICAAVG